MYIRTDEQTQIHRTLAKLGSNKKFKILLKLDIYPAVNQRH